MTKIGSKKKVYYAHFMGIYNTPQEERDIKTLESLGLEVLNPNTPKTQNECDIAFKNAKTNKQYHKAFSEIFFTKVAKCEVFAFRPLPDGRIPGGVFKELQEAQRLNKIIIELPCGTYSRGMGKEDTREYLKDIGQR